MLSEADSAASRVGSALLVVANRNHFTFSLLHIIPLVYFGELHL